MEKLPEKFLQEFLDSIRKERLQKSLKEFLKIKPGNSGEIFERILAESFGQITGSTFARRPKQILGEIFEKNRSFERKF